MLWQLAYAEFHFTSVLWPDFRKEHFFRRHSRLPKPRTPLRRPSPKCQDDEREVDGVSRPRRLWMHGMSVMHLGQGDDNPINLSLTSTYRLRD